MVNPVSRPTGSAAVQGIAGTAEPDTNGARTTEQPSPLTGEGNSAGNAAGRRAGWSLMQKLVGRKHGTAPTPVAGDAVPPHVDPAHSASTPAASTPAAPTRTDTAAEVQNSESTDTRAAAVPDDSTGSHPAARPDLHGTHPDPHAQGGDMMDQQKMLMKQQNEAMITQIQMQTEMSQKQNVVQLITGNIKSTETAFAALMSSTVDSAKSEAELLKKGGDAVSAAI